MDFCRENAQFLSKNVDFSDEIDKNEFLKSKRIKE
jgi:hypothetical protein